jgi:hypothetical protein
MPDDMSHLILMELHKYSTAQKNGTEYIFLYVKEPEKSMNIYSLHGHKVRVTTKTLGNGSREEQLLVDEQLSCDVPYTVDKTIVSEFSTQVYLKEREGICFNSVNFEDIHSQSESDDRKHPDYKKFNP